VKEKQQLMNPSSFGLVPKTPRPEVVTAEPEPCLTVGLYRNTQEVRTAFWVESNATLPYF